MSSTVTTADARHSLRVRLIWERWLSLIGQAVVAAAICLLALHWRRSDIKTLLEAPRWAIAAACVGLLGLTYRSGRGRWGPFTGLRHFHSYPPLWLAVLLGVSMVLTVLRWLPDLSGHLRLTDLAISRSLCVGWTIVGVAVATAVVSLWKLSRLNEAVPERADREPASEWTIRVGSFEEICAWVTDDRPVERLSGDAFGHARIAARIASRLVHRKPPAQAVIGKLGSGKTTLRHFVADALGKEDGGDKVRLVPVELWPYETPRAAVNSVIGSLIEALSHEVNVFSLRGVPGAYTEAMSAAGGIWSGLARLQGIPSDPFESLKAVDQVATMIGLDFVVWIEDLERFAGGEPDEPDEERLSPIRALLYGLDQLESVTVLTATTTLQTRFDIEKIARYVEQLPELPGNRVRGMLRVFRDGLNGTTLVDPASPKVRRQLGDATESFDMRVVQSLIGPGVHGLPDALPTLCSTPRVLKSALRSCLDTWSRLRGEIDVDDVLVLSVLREAQPNAFALIEDHIPFLQGRLAKDYEKKGEEAWEAALAALKVDENTRRAVKYIIGFAFDDDADAEKPQGVRHRNHADYWQRFLAVPRLSKTEQDQPILARILKKGGAADDDLLSLMEDDERALAVEDFGRLIENTRLEGLLVPLVERRAKERASEWPNRRPIERPPGFRSLLRLWNVRVQQDGLSADAVWRELRRSYEIAVPRNLSLAVTLETALVASSRHVFLGYGENSYRERAKEHLRRLLLDTFVGKAPDLVRTLDGAESYVLAWAAWGIERIQAGRLDEVPFADWKPFADTIVQAISVNRRIMLPQLASLVTVAVDGAFEARYAFSEDLAERLFGHPSAVMDLFRGEDRAGWTDRNVLAVLAAVEAAAPTVRPGDVT
jgi:hypothetical protein